MNLDPADVGLKPFHDFGAFVVRSIVSDEVNFVGWVLTNQLFEKTNKGVTVELLFLETKVPYGIFAYGDCTERFDALASGKAHDLAAFADGTPRMGE